MAIRLLPAALLALFNLPAKAQTARSGPGSRMTPATAPELDLMRQVLSAAAVTTDFGAVTQPLTHLPHDPARVEQADWGVSYSLPRGVVTEIMVHIDRPEHGQRRTHPPRVTAIQAIFRPNQVRLSDLQSKFGPWYRDPPDGDKASLASAYFNAKLIHPKARYFLLATTGSGYEELLSPAEFAQTLAATWREDRYSTEGRPW